MSKKREQYDHEFKARSCRRPWKRRYSVRISRTVRSAVDPKGWTAWV